MMRLKYHKYFVNVLFYCNKEPKIYSRHSLKFH